MKSTPPLHPVAIAVILALRAIPAHSADGLPQPAPVQGVPKELISVGSSLGVDYVVGTISYLADATKPFVDQATAESIGVANAQLIANYHASMRDARFGASQFHASMNLAIVSGTVYASTSGIGAPIAIPTGYVATKLNDAARDYLVANTQARASAALSAGLQKMSADDQALMDNLLKAGEYGKATAHFERTSSALSAMKAKLADDPAAQQLLDKSVDAAMRQGSVVAIRTAGAALNKVGDLEEEFVGYTRKFAEYGRKTDDALKKLEKGTRDLSDQIKGLQSEVSDLADATTANGVQIAVIQQVLYDQQPPSVKLAMLDSGALPGLDESQKNTLRKALNVQIQQQELVGTITQVVGYARDLNTIMGAFGASDPGLQRAVSYGNVAAQALTQAFTGNYLGAVASVAGLFGGGAPPDPMAEHMKVIMAAFDGVNKRLNAVLELQQQTLEAIYVLNNNLNVLRRETHARFDRVDFELAQLGAGQRQIIWQPLTVCENAYALQDANLIGEPAGTPRRNRYDARSQRFVSFDAMREYTASYGNTVYRCAEYLSELFNSFRDTDGLASNALSLAFAETKFGAAAGVAPPDPPVVRPKPNPGEMTQIEYGMPALAYYKSRLYEPSYQVFQYGWSSGNGWGGLANGYAMLTRPSSSVKVLHDRMEALRTTGATTPFRPCVAQQSLLGGRLQDYLCTNTTVYIEPPAGAAALADADSLARRRAEGFLSKPILRDQVGRLMDYALFIAGPREIVQGIGDDPPYMLAELAKSGHDPRGKILLNRALTIVDVSIAQQSMLYGDMTAYFIADLLWDSQVRRFRSKPAENTDATIFAHAQRLLQNANNPWLRRNVAMIILKRAQNGCDAREQGEKCQQNNLLYDLAFDRFFKVGADNNYSEVDSVSHAAATGTFRRVFNLHADARFTVVDAQQQVGGKGMGPRTIMLTLDGYDLPLPNRNDWRQGTLQYPPLLHDRLADRERVGSRLAGYSAFDHLSDTQKQDLMTLLANQKLQ